MYVTLAVLAYIQIINILITPVYSCLDFFVVVNRKSKFTHSIQIKMHKQLNFTRGNDLSRNISPSPHFKGEIKL